MNQGRPSNFEAFATTSHSGGRGNGFKQVSLGALNKQPTTTKKIVIKGFKGKTVKQ